MYNKCPYKASNGSKCSHKRCRDNNNCRYKIVEKCPLFKEWSKIKKEELRLVENGYIEPF